MPYNQLKSDDNAFQAERLREPFLAVTPQKIFAKQGMMERLKERLLRTASPDQMPKLRAQMLQIALSHFATREENVQQRIEQYTHPAYSSIDTVFVSVCGSLHESFEHVAAQDTEFKRLMALYDRSHNGKTVPYAPRHSGGLSEMQEFVRHGTSVMVGLLEVLPQVYERQYGMLPSETEHRKLLEVGADRMMSTLARMPGYYATAMEEALKKRDKHLGFESRTLKRMVFDQGYFKLREMVDGLELDLHAGTVDDLLEQLRVRRTDYHGCLAGLVKIDTREQPHRAPTGFVYMQNLITRLILEAQQRERSVAS